MRVPKSTKYQIRDALVARAAGDERVLAAVDYGSHGQGVADEWSDFDLVLFVRDDACDALAAGWIDWVAGLGTILLAYDPGGHPRVVFDADPVPVNFDLAFFRAAQVADIDTWPTPPTSVDAMVLVDKTPGRAGHAAAKRLIARGTSAPDLPSELAHVVGDLWYYALRVYALSRRGDAIAARTEYHWYVLNNLAALARIEAGRLGRWRSSLAAARLRNAVTPLRIAEIESCIPGPTPFDLDDALLRAITLGQRLIQHLAAAHPGPPPPALPNALAQLLGASTRRTVG